MTDSARVLIVEDEPDLAWVERFNLETEGYVVEVALEGRAAMVAIDTFRPHLVLLDVMLPHVDGWSVLAHAQSMPQKDRPRVILVSALPGVTERAAAKESPAVDGFLSKPFEMDELLRKVRRTLGRG
jgi:DNA-binding response OmpR family regulator